MHKWTLAFFLFTIFFWAFKLTTGSGRDAFDPSGHISAGLISVNCHYSSYRFCSTKINELLRVKVKTTDIPDAYYKLNRVTGVTSIVYLAFLVHTTYSLFWTVFIFHSVVESVTGFLFGVFISLTVFETDTFSDALSYIIASLKG